MIDDDQASSLAIGANHVIVPFSRHNRTARADSMPGNPDCDIRSPSSMPARTYSMQSY